MTETTTSKFINFKLDVWTFLALCGAMYLAYAAHMGNMQNTQQLSALLTKYEQTLDAAIAGDKNTFKQYQTNLKQAVQSLSPKERKLVLALLEIERSNKDQ